MVYEIHLFYGRSTRCRRCSNAIKAKNQGTGKIAALRARRAAQPVVSLSQIERSQAQKNAQANARLARASAEARWEQLQRKQAEDRIRLMESARVKQLRLNGLL